MSKKQWMVLLMLFLTYLLLGASIFYHIESRLEIERVEEAKHERIEINALLHAHYRPRVGHNQNDILAKLTQYCGKSVYNYTEEETDPLKWDFYNSFYFAYTVVSTIGYGNLAPTNMLSRILMIFYGLIGIPMNGILLTQLGEFFGGVFVQAHQKYKSYKHGRDNYHPRKLTIFETGKLGLAAQIFAHLLPGFVMFIFFPAFLFSYYEGWSYDEAVYYAFVTLTTIGFGDYVAGQDNDKGSGASFMLYKTFLICWISFGLGYTVMIMTFIGRGMRSKKITRIEHKLAVNLKHTQSKIWNEFNKEIGYLRRVFNELQLSKVKRVYVDECYCEIPSSQFPRSNSFPDLRLLSCGSKGKESIPREPRRRANSEVVATDDQVTRVVSETDLQRIDKTATFASHAMVQPAELLARLVNILGYLPPATDDTGDDGSNQTTYVGQDLPSNVTGAWTIGLEKVPYFSRPRQRTTSEVKLPEAKHEERNVERTWSGPTAVTKIRDLLKDSRSAEVADKERYPNKESKFSKLRSFAFATKTVPKALMSSGRWRSRFSTSLEKSEEKEKEKEKDKEKKEKEMEKEDTERSSAQEPALNDERRESAWTHPHVRSHYFTHTGAAPARNSDFVREGVNSLLEETSLADFLRALTVLHATVAAKESWGLPVNEELIPQEEQPRRKLGTASLTPPKLPSLFTLFSPSSQTSADQSDRNTVTPQSNENWSYGKPNWSENRRESRRNSSAVGPVKAAKTRRFSLRPVATPISPPTPPRSSSPFLADTQRSQYAAGKAMFLFESPKEPLIQTEGVPGLSSPVKAPVNARRFSLRSSQGPSGNGGSTPVPVGPAIKSLNRWKAGMLQRQIGQMNLRRRSRAFSLSDVNTEQQQQNERTEPFRDGVGGKNVVLRQVSTNDKSAISFVPERVDPYAIPVSALSQEPLTEVRVENPAAATFQRPDAGSGDTRAVGKNLIDLAELKIEKHTPESNWSES